MECEVKFKIEDKKEILKKLQSLGAQDLGKNLESDTYYGLGEKSVRIRKINKDKEGFITVKKLVETDSRAKIKEEIETKVSDIEKAVKILEELGFSAVKRKEKIRHTFKLGNVFVLIDKLPFMGYFVELEAASEKDIKNLTKKLGFDYNQASGESYDNIFFKYYIKNARRFKDTKVNIIPVFESEKQFLKEEVYGNKNEETPRLRSG